MTLAQHFALILEEHRQSQAAPLSVRKALLVVVLLDHFGDRVFAQFRDSRPALMQGAADLPAWRALLAARSEALATIFALGSGRSEAAALRIAAVEVPIADYPALPVEDFMVSLYNQNSVQRVVIAKADGSTMLAQSVLGEAVAWWDNAGWR